MAESCTQRNDWGKSEQDWEGRVETCAPWGDIGEPHLLNIWREDLNTSSGLLRKS